MSQVKLKELDQLRRAILAGGWHLEVKQGGASPEARLWLKDCEQRIKRATAEMSNADFALLVYLLKGKEPT